VSYLFPSSTITVEAALRDLANGSPKARAFAAHALGDVTDTTEVARAVDALIIALAGTWSPVSATFTASTADDEADHERRRAALRRVVARALVP
jgi:hypothetical protein